MKKFFKALALVLALALVIGVVPAQATSAKVKAKKTLYFDGAKGTSTDGKLTSGYKGRVAIYKLAGDTKAVAKEHTYKAVIKSGDTVTKTKKYVYAADKIGKSVVEIFKDGESLGTTVVTVKKNATDATLTLTGLEDGQEVVCGVTYTVTLPRKGADNDERRLFVDDKAVADKEDAPRAYDVVFTTVGDHKIKFEAFQSAELDAVTTPAKEITVKAVMPQPTKIKQLSTNSFAVIFESSMKDLIDTSKVKNDDIYYIIAGEHITTGALKSVELDKDDPTRVIVTRYTDFIEGETYYFHYGDSEDLSFVAAVSKLANVDYIKVSVDGTCYVDAVTEVFVKYYDKNDVELNLAAEALPVLDITSATDCAYPDTTAAGKPGIWFTAEGVATIKATVTLGYDEETYAPIEKTATLEVTGVKKGAAEVKTVDYSFTANAADKVTFIRMGEAAVDFTASFKQADGTEVLKVTTTDMQGYYLKSTAEDYAQITDKGTGAKNAVTGVNIGNAVILLCYTDDKGAEQVLKAFPVEVKEANKPTSNVTTTISGSTLNIFDFSTAPDPDDAVVLEVKTMDLNGKEWDSSDLTYEVKQLDNNMKSSGVVLGAVAEDVTDTKKAVFTFDNSNVSINDTLPNTTYLSTGTGRLAFELTVKKGSTTLATKTFSIVVANVSPATLKTPNNKTANPGYKVVADNTELDISRKNFKHTSVLDGSLITVQKTGSVNGAQFYLGTEKFTVIKSTGDIPVNQPVSGSINYLIPSTPYGTNSSNNIMLADRTTEINGFAGPNNISVPNASNIALINFLGNNQDMADNATGVAKAGTYTFAGVRVKYETADASNPGRYKQTGSRTSLGSANVVVRGTDATATYAEKATITASNLKDVIADPVANPLSDYFKVNWDGISSDSTGLDAGRIEISLEAGDYKVDTSTDSVYIYKITAVIYTYDNTNRGAGQDMKYTTKVTVNKLYKDK